MLEPGISTGLPQQPVLPQGIGHAETANNSLAPSHLPHQLPPTIITTKDNTLPLDVQTIEPTQKKKEIKYLYRLDHKEITI